MADPPPAERTLLSSIVTDPSQALGAADPTTRRIAVAAALAHPDLHQQVVAMLRSDAEPMVRRECAEMLGLAGGSDHSPLVAALGDTDAAVREAAVTALGELEAGSTVPELLTLARADTDNLVREAAVAALGAIGDAAAVPTLLELIGDGPPQVRRRCVAALTVFEGDEVEAALRSAARDRNPMVREAAEMVVGRTVE